jgi:hypothetical protein
MVWSHIPFALFPLVELETSVSDAKVRCESAKETQTINSVLNYAFKGTNPVHVFLLAPISYDDLPKHESGKLHQGDEPPISSDYKTPWSSKKVEDAAEWMRNIPAEKDIDHNFFAILDKSAADGKIVICRIGGRNLRDLSSLDWLRFPAEDGALKLRVTEPGDWEQDKERKGDDKIRY